MALCGFPVKYECMTCFLELFGSSMALSLKMKWPENDMLDCNETIYTMVTMSVTSL